MKVVSYLAPALTYSFWRASASARNISSEVSGEIMILLITGEENFLSFEKLKQVKEKFAEKNMGESNIDEFDEKSFTISKFQKSILSMPFLSEKRLIIVKNIFSSKMKKEDGEKIIDCLNNIPESTIVVFWEDKEISKKDLLAKKITNLAKKNWDFPKLKPYEIEKWAKEKIDARKTTIEKPALLKLAADSDNLWELNQEIEKLTLYKNKIEEADIELLVSPKLNNNVFELIDSIAEKDLKKTLKFLNNLIEQGEEIIYLLRMVVYQVRNLILIKELALKNLKKGEIIKETGKHPFVVEKTLRQIKNFSQKELETIYNEIFNLEVKIKTGSIEPVTGINLLALQLCLKQ